MSLGIIRVPENYRSILANAVEGLQGQYQKPASPGNADTSVQRHPFAQPLSTSLNTPYHLRRPSPP
ncbi:uncharacterized protein RHO25_005506 [Cercospora beticola]|uniref:Uncharacterized protein n=1 Tax=Cercospora beticola TaxID=122368 RepID=A0ABZ0NMW2_CERBT|nr:hypothetical protein RHO25_005506 [Cercospora beticola]